MTGVCNVIIAEMLKAGNFYILSFWQCFSVFINCMNYNPYIIKIIFIEVIYLQESEYIFVNLRADNKFPFVFRDVKHGFLS
jgi:hypothetical protein